MKNQDQQLQEFTKYFNSFYGTSGIYPIRDVQPETITEHLKKLQKRFEGYYQFTGDSVDREYLRDSIFTSKELKKAYQ